MKAIKTIPIILLIGCLVNCSSTNRKNNYNYNRQQVKPGSIEYTLAEGISALNRFELDLAEKKLLEVVRKNPALINAQNALGLTYLYKKDYNQALNHLQNVLKLNPTYYDAYNSLGLVYLALGDRQKAKENFLTAANAVNYSTRENCFVNLAIMEIEENNWQDAYRYVNNGLEARKDFAPLYNLLGIVLEQQNRFEEAIEAFRKAIALSRSDQGDYYFNLGKVFNRIGKRNEALDALEKALSLIVEPEQRKRLIELINEIKKS